MMEHKSPLKTFNPRPKILPPMTNGGRTSVDMGRSKGAVSREGKLIKTQKHAQRYPGVQYEVAEVTFSNEYDKENVANEQSRTSNHMSAEGSSEWEDAEHPADLISAGTFRNQFTRGGMMSRETLLSRDGNYSRGGMPSRDSQQEDAKRVMYSDQPRAMSPGFRDAFVNSRDGMSHEEPWREVGETSSSQDEARMAMGTRAGGKRMGGMATPGGRPKTQGVRFDSAPSSMSEAIPPYSISNSRPHTMTSPTKKPGSPGPEQAPRGWTAMGLRPEPSHVGSSNILANEMSVQMNRNGSFSMKDVPSKLRAHMDVSFRDDRTGHGRDPKKGEFVDFQIPASIIPISDHVVKTLPVAPDQKRYDCYFDENENKWKTVVFPALKPVSRRDVMMLEKWMDAKLQDRKAPADQMDIVDVIKEAHFIYSTAFHEIIRQVGCHCVERGRLLSKVWFRYVELFDRVISAYAIDRNKYEEEAKKMRHEINVLFEKTLLENALEQEKIRDEVRDRIESLEKSNENLTVKLQALHTEKEKQSDDFNLRMKKTLDNERKNWANVIDDMQEEQDKLLAENSRLKSKQIALAFRMDMMRVENIKLKVEAGYDVDNEEEKISEKEKEKKFQEEEEVNRLLQEGSHDNIYHIRKIVARLENRLALIVQSERDPNEAVREIINAYIRTVGEILQAGPGPAANVTMAELLRRLAIVAGQAMSPEMGHEMTTMSGIIHNSTHVAMPNGKEDKTVASIDDNFSKSYTPLDVGFKEESAMEVELVDLLLGQTRESDVARRTQQTKEVDVLRRDIANLQMMMDEREDQHREDIDRLLKQRDAIRQDEHLVGSLGAAVLRGGDEGKDISRKGSSGPGMIRTASQIEMGIVPFRGDDVLGLYKLMERLSEPMCPKCGGTVKSGVDKFKHIFSEKYDYSDDQKRINNSGKLVEALNDIEHWSEVLMMDQLQRKRMHRHGSQESTAVDSAGLAEAEVDVEGVAVSDEESGKTKKGPKKRKVKRAGKSPAKKTKEDSNLDSIAGSREVSSDDDDEHDDEKLGVEVAASPEKDEVKAYAKKKQIFHPQSMKIWGNIKDSLKVAKPMKWLQERIVEIYNGKILQDSNDDKLRIARSQLPAYIQAYNVQQYGLKKIANKNMGMLLGSVKAHQGKGGRRLAMFMAFAGLSDTFYPLDDLNIFLFVLKTIKQKVPQILLKPEQASTDFMSKVGRIILRDRDIAEGFVKQLRKQAGGPKVDFDLAMELLLQSFQTVSREKLQVLYRATDSNGDQMIDFKEFTSMIHSLDVNIREDKILVMFNDALALSQKYAIIQRAHKRYSSMLIEEPEKARDSSLEDMIEVAASQENNDDDDDDDEEDKLNMDAFIAVVRNAGLMSIDWCKRAEQTMISTQWEADLGERAVEVAHDHRVLRSKWASSKDQVLASLLLLLQSKPDYMDEIKAVQDRAAQLDKLLESVDDYEAASMAHKMLEQDLEKLLNAV